MPIVRLGFLTTLLLTWFCEADLAAMEPSRRPNIALILADDLRADVMSIYGGPVGTPHLEQLARRGSLFRRASCGYPICHVSRTEILTGRFLVAEATQGKSVPFDPAWSIWPRHFQDAGWHTIHSGKWHVEGTPKSRGFSNTSALYSSGGGVGRPLTFPRSSTDRIVSGYNGWTFKSPQNVPELELGIGLTPQTDHRIADGAIQAIEQHSRDAGAQPLFLHVNFTGPHDPLHWPSGVVPEFDLSRIKLPPNFRSSHGFDHGNEHGRDEEIVPAPRSPIDVQRERMVYEAIVRNLDHQVGRILDSIERSSQPKSWIILFSSDQGLALGSHGLMGKQNQYEHTCNAPLLIAGEDIPQGVVWNQDCGLRDLFPTLCQLSNLAIPQSVEGKSLLPLMRREVESVHDAIFGYFTDTQRMIRTKDHWKLIWYPKQNRSQLFDLTQDPDELHDLSSLPEHAVRKAELFSRLKTWLIEHRDPVVAP